MNLSVLIRTLGRALGWVQQGAEAQQVACVLAAFLHFLFSC